ncbi:uncharacterized protein N7459_007373 [Penicillium hispanicum]|uniref:uncharacterized protein n=1 Tax=Penicillium hispanicum TaxID=1080232 RepID=UPI002541AB29|nr:uncharacterized protein N7459_007373 [Penicillium hispanicum]KAJ5578409.1 hypothetical protein N7459_007373 [Penicillium hispanicum]
MVFRFLGSDTVELCTSACSRPFKIHQKLLESTCKAPAVALKHDYLEGSSKRYTFTETTDDTVVQFIEWAYKGDYTGSTSAPIATPQENTSEDPPQSPISKPPSEHLEDIKVPQAHTLLSHLRVYVFSEVYLVSGLKQLSFQKFTAVLMDMGKPKDLDEQLAVIDRLALAFSRLPLHDKLLEWLAQYAAWCLDKLRVQSQFHNLLKSLPAISSRMMEKLNPANEAPWDTKWHNYKVPSYDARADFFVPYEY